MDADLKKAIDGIGQRLDGMDQRFDGIGQRLGARARRTLP